MCITRLYFLFLAHNASVHILMSLILTYTGIILYTDTFISTKLAPTENYHLPLHFLSSQLHTISSHCSGLNSEPGSLSQLKSVSFHCSKKENRNSQFSIMGCGFALRR